MARLETLVYDSDPDTSLSQMEHNLQTAIAIRRDIRVGSFSPDSTWLRPR